MAVYSVGLVSLLSAMTLGETMGWTALPILGLLAASLIAFAIFIPIERRKGSEAMFDLTLFSHNRLFTAANLAALLNYTAFFAVGFIISFYLQRVLELTALETGAILIALPLTMGILAPISGWASDKIGSRVLATGGMAIISIGLLLLSTLTISSHPGTVILYLFVVGAGMGLFSSPNTNAIMGSVEKRQLGVASGMVATMRTTGMSLGLALTGAIIATVVSSDVINSLFAGTDPSQIVVESTAFVRGMNLAFMVSAVVAAIGAVFSSARGKAKTAVLPSDQ